MVERAPTSAGQPSSTSADSSASRRPASSLSPVCKQKVSFWASAELGLRVKVATSSAPQCGVDGTGGINAPPTDGTGPAPSALFGTLWEELDAQRPALRTGAGFA